MSIESSLTQIIAAITEVEQPKTRTVRVAPGFNGTNIPLGETQKKAVAFNNQLHNSIKMGEWDRGMQLLRTAQDEALGIHAHYNKTARLYSRDARQQHRKGVDNVMADCASFATMGLALLQNAEMLLDIHGKITEDDNKVLRDSLKAAGVTFIQQMLANKQEAAWTLKQFIHEYVKPLVADQLLVSPQKALALLAYNRHLAQMHVVPDDVVTQSRIVAGGKSTDIFQAEITGVEMTPALREEWKTALGEEPPQWFTAQSSVKQKILKYHLEKILENNKDGDRIQLSSQLYNTLPGAKNVGMKVTGVVEERNGTKKANILNKTFHSGTFATLVPKTSKDERLRLTKMTGDQLSDWMRSDVPEAQKQDTPVHFAVLNSALNPTGADNPIVTHSLNASEAKGAQFSVSNLPFNVLRRVSHNQTAAMKIALNSIVTFLPEINESGGLIEDFLLGKTSRYPKTAIKALKATGETLERIVQAIQLACKLKRKLSQRKVVADKNNENLARLALFNQICFLLDWRSASMCKSGKDRAGSAMFMTTHRALYEHFRGVGAADDHSDKHSLSLGIAEALAADGHQQHMAGERGATLGCRGLIHHALAALPVWFSQRIKRAVVRKTGSYNRKQKIFKHFKRQKNRPNPYVLPTSASLAKCKKGIIKHLEKYIAKRTLCLAAMGFFGIEKGGINPNLTKGKIKHALATIHTLRALMPSAKIEDDLQATQDALDNAIKTNNELAVAEKGEAVKNKDDGELAKLLRRVVVASAA